MGSDRHLETMNEMPERMAKLKTENAQLKAQVAGSGSEIARLHHEIARLRAENDWIAHDAWKATLSARSPSDGVALDRSMDARPADVFLSLNSGRARVSHLNSIKIESGYQRCPFSPQRFIVSDPLDWEIDDITVVSPDRVPRSQLSRNQQVPGQWLTAIALSTPWSFDPVDAGHGNVVMTVRYVGHKETDHFVCSVVGRSLEGP